MNKMGANLTKVLLITLPFMISSCATNKPSMENVKSIEQVNQESMALITNRAAIESEKLFQQQQEIINRIERIAQQEKELEPVVPKFDPLE